VTSPRRADAELVFACLLWGISFVVVKEALGHSTPMAFAAVRFAIASLLMAPFAGLHRRFTGVEVAGGIVLALLLGIGFLAQTAGLVWTTPSRSAFLVALSSVLAPAIAVVALRERPGRPLLLALGLAAVGVYWLTAPDRGGLNRGDLLTLITAVLYGGHIVTIGALSRRGDVGHLVWLQITGTALLAGAGTLFLESPRIAWSPAFMGQLAYTAVPATVVPLLLQMRAQRQISAARAALLFTSESMFAAATSWLVLGERLSPIQWLGGGLILASMVIVELRPVSPRTASHVEVPGARGDISARFDPE
jgi:drug/metabolite transporter (DMT)-like permease